MPTHLRMLQLERLILRTVAWSKGHGGRPIAWFLAVVFTVLWVPVALFLLLLLALGFGPSKAERESNRATWR